MQNNAVKALLSGRRYLLLQGPMGPFFSKLSAWLETLGRETVQVVFNGGDRFYCRNGNYRVFNQLPKTFPAWLEDLYQEYPFDTILCFGDCRPLHQLAHRWTDLKDVRFLAFEEGYLRPHFITLEAGGVNAYSATPREPEFYHHLEESPAATAEELRLKPSSLKRMWHAAWYYLVSWYVHEKYPHYQHHKSFSPWYEARCWFRAGWRKVWYKYQQRNVLGALQTTFSERYYLAVLQVYNDSQIRNHSHYDDVRDFINEVMLSFSHHAPPTTMLVFKHHPMGRGHRLYKPLILRLGKKYGIHKRVIYVHDIPVPELLTHTKAVITINSTAGLSALIHNKPLKVMGKALYNIREITYQGDLNQFWNSDFKPDIRLFKKFRNWLLKNTQINAVYYGKKPHDDFSSTIATSSFNKIASTYSMTNKKASDV